jgi:uncharacterized membrane protein (DUF485 family)
VTGTTAGSRPRADIPEVISVSDTSNEPRPPTPQRTHQRSGHAAYETLHASEEFSALRRKYRAFAIPWTIAFLAWYLLYVIMSNWATGFMDTKVAGNINVALIFGLLQFVSTFAIAFIYSKHAAKNFDPLARTLEKRYNDEVGHR